MTILNAEILPKAGPNIEFAILPASLDIDEWPRRELYQEYIFFKCPDNHLGTICSLTHTCLFFDKYRFLQIHNPEDIYCFVSDILRMASLCANVNETLPKQ